MSREELASAIDRSWSAWSEAIDGVPADRATEPGVCGYYSLKDLIGHIAFWDEQDLARAHRISQGEEVAPNDWATMNDLDFEAHKGDPLEAQQERMRAAHDRLRLDLQRFQTIDGLKLEDTWSHYDAHRDDVLAWRSAEGV